MRDAEGYMIIRSGRWQRSRRAGFRRAGGSWRGVAGLGLAGGAGGVYARTANH